MLVDLLCITDSYPYPRLQRHTAALFRQRVLDFFRRHFSKTLRSILGEGAVRFSISCGLFRPVLD